MEVSLLRSFLVVAEAGTITDAAARLHVSQSALSRRVQQLEQELGAELVVRGRHGVELTVLGHQARAEAQAIVARYDRLRDDIADHLQLGQGVVRLGGGATVTSYVLPEAIGEFQRRHPGVRFRLKEAGSHDVAGAVAGGELELGLVTLPVPDHDLEVGELLVDEIVLVGRRDHPLTAAGSVTAGDLRGHPFVAFEPRSAIRDIVDRALGDAGARIDVVMELRSIPSILRMVATTGCLAFVSRVSLASEPGLRSIPVRDLSIARTIGLASRAAMPLSAPAAAFASLLRDRLGPVP
jgi:LysR family transcriptional regulator, cyn operon transcriptional activator